MAFSDLSGAILGERYQDGKVIGCVEVGKVGLVLCQDCFWATCPKREMA